MKPGRRHGSALSPPRAGSSGGRRVALIVAACLADDRARLFATGTGVFKRAPQEKLK
tara:strand:+ start:407 stop:577 length:171 start_codon:yes stop_codon:yes gene_type:complete